MRLKIENILITAVPALIVIGMLIGLIYLLVDNARLEFVNTVNEYKIEQKQKNIDAAKKEIEDVKGDLVEWQNTANGYKFELDLLKKDNGWSEDE
ncbi:hypothetical protein LHA31_10235 [Carnobacterium viridans]|uniref:Uncharacterized protein n=1 Tax=Carnobacterium viridans TaxID=174587 RepID=A0A1H0YVJ5_9LACT|nr:hypothetical protein [Carnobacterium viridans]UDE94923.1 hypothetical protein LHA31_10235 [Carnobacterium viridans]SDQ19195.1 hypothetical protein SAMN04487752_1179 [Carnobacterium viridans]